MAAPTHIVSNTKQEVNFASTATVALNGGGTTANKVVFAMLTTSASGGASPTGCVVNPGSIAMTEITSCAMTRSGRPVKIYVLSSGVPDGDITVVGTWSGGSWRPQMIASMFGGVDGPTKYSGETSGVDGSTATSHSIGPVTSSTDSIVLTFSYCGGSVTQSASAGTTEIFNGTPSTYAGLSAYTKTGAATVTSNWTTGSLDVCAKFSVSINGASSSPYPPAGTTTVSSAVGSSTSAVITYSYDLIDQTGYEYQLNGGSWASISTSPATITGLTADTEYSVKVRAINSYGNGTASAAVAFGTTNPITGGGMIGDTSASATTISNKIMSIGLRSS